MWFFVCISINVCALCVSGFLCDCVFIYQLPCVFVCVFVSLCVTLFVRLIICLLRCLFICCLGVCLCFCEFFVFSLSVVCLSVYTILLYF